MGNEIPVMRFHADHIRTSFSHTRISFRGDVTDIVLAMSTTPYDSDGVADRYINSFKYEMRRPRVAQSDHERCLGATRSGLRCFEPATLDAFCPTHHPASQHTCGAMTDDGGACRWGIIREPCPEHGSRLAVDEDLDYSPAEHEVFARTLVAVWRKDATPYAGSVTHLDRRRARQAAHRLRLTPYSSSEFVADLRAWADHYRWRFDEKEQWLEVAEAAGAAIHQRRRRFRNHSAMSDKQAASLARQFALWSWREYDQCVRDAM